MKKVLFLLPIIFVFSSLSIAETNMKNTQLNSEQILKINKLNKLNESKLNDYSCAIASKHFGDEETMRFFENKAADKIAKMTKLISELFPNGINEQSSVSDILHDDYDEGMVDGLFISNFLPKNYSRQEEKDISVLFYKENNCDKIYLGK